MFCLLIIIHAWYNSTKQTATVLPHYSPKVTASAWYYSDNMPCGSACVETSTVLEINSARSGQYNFPNVMKFLQKGG